VFVDLLKGASSVTGIENFKLDRDIEIIHIENPESNTKVKLDGVLKQEFLRVFIFLEFYFINAFLAKYFKDKGSIICLANDGNRPYYRVNRKAYKSKVFETIKFYQAILKENLYPVPVYLYNLTYGNLRYINEYWMPFEPSVKWAHIKSNVVIYSLSSESFINSLRQSFLLFDDIKKLPQFENVILYTNNIVYRQEVYDEEIRALTKVKANTGLPLIIKMHPATPEFQEKKFREIGMYVFKSSIPAEIYLLYLKNSIILSGWSSSLLLEVNENKYFWLYKYFLSLNLPLQDLVDFALPQNHIQHPEDLSQIQYKQ
jgi:hypothetical protein